jgi:hypothetical protein
MSTAPRPAHEGAADVDDEDDWRATSPDASRIGTAVEYLVAATCLLASRGQLNVSTAPVDDEGVDLVFHRRGAPATLAVQVKARTTDGSVIRSGRFHAQVGGQTFRPRPDYYLLFGRWNELNNATAAVPGVGRADHGWGEPWGWCPPRLTPELPYRVDRLRPGPGASLITLRLTCRSRATGSTRSEPVVTARVFLCRNLRSTGGRRSRTLMVLPAMASRTRSWSHQCRRLLDHQEGAFPQISWPFPCSASPAWGTNLRTGRRETCWLDYDPSVNRSSISKLPLVRDVLYDPGGLRASGLAFPGHRKL